MGPGGPRERRCSRCSCTVGRARIPWASRRTRRGRSPRRGATVAADATRASRWRGRTCPSRRGNPRSRRRGGRGSAGLGTRRRVTRWRPAPPPPPSNLRRHPRRPRPRRPHPRRPHPRRPRHPGRPPPPSPTPRCRGSRRAAVRRRLRGAGRRPPRGRPRGVPGRRDAQTVAQDGERRAGGTRRFHADARPATTYRTSRGPPWPAVAVREDARGARGAAQAPRGDDGGGGCGMRMGNLSERDGMRMGNLSERDGRVAASHRPGLSASSSSESSGRAEETMRRLATATAPTS